MNGVNVQSSTGAEIRHKNSDKKTPKLLQNADTQ